MPVEERFGTHNLDKSGFYLGKKNLKAAGVQIDYTAEEIDEWLKCRSDPDYFFENYVYIVDLDDGRVKFIPRDYQRKIIHTCIENRFVICKLPRQYGKTTAIAAMLCWYILFHQDMNIAVLAHKAEQAREILGRVQLAYEALPFFLQQGVVRWNRGDIELENGSKIETESTSSGSIRGRSYNIVYMDEFAHVEPNVQEEFFTATYPTITAGKKTKILITSTPKGLEYFYKIWRDSEKGNNDYIRVDCHWSDLPGRDENWKADIIRNTSERQFQQEFETEFLGSSATLIEGRKLAVIPTMSALNEGEREDILIYEKPVKGRPYVCCVDTSRGSGIDYSAFVVIDIAEIPYKVVATYQNNEIPSMLYPNVVYRACKLYNDAFCLVENNDIGAQVADILHMDMDYENMFSSQTKGRAGQSIGGLGSISRNVGMRMTKATKRIGCASLKTIVETDKIVLNSMSILAELSTFVVKKQSYEADSGAHDDLVMCLVMFSWLVNQDYFKELIDHDIRKNLEKVNEDFIDQDLTPFGMIDDGIEMITHDGNYDYSDPDFGKW